MRPPTYIVRRILREVGKGITSPVAATLDGILKFDSDESPHAVYNELVAQRIGERIGAPIVAGGLTVVVGGEAFASLKSGSPGMVLPDFQTIQGNKVAKAYPQQTASLLVFDVFIGNWDRRGNLKAATVSPHLQLFAAFDHGHALLSADKDVNLSIARLAAQDPIAVPHPLAGVADQWEINRAIERIKRLLDEDIQSCCVLGSPFRGVPLDVQQRLSQALCARRDRIDILIKALKP